MLVLDSLVLFGSEFTVVILWFESPAGVEDAIVLAVEDVLSSSNDREKSKE